MRRAWRYLLRAMASLGFLFALVTVTPIDNWWIRALAGPWNDPSGDVLIVLSADSMTDVIGWSSYWRSVYAVRAWRQGGWREILVTGGGANGQVPTAQRMRDFMLSQGVPGTSARMETQAQTTRENALRSKPILEQMAGRKILMTSDYHMFRASRAFRKAGLAVEPRPIPDAAKQATRWMNRWSVFLNLCGETIKIAYYFVRGWI